MKKILIVDDEPELVKAMQVRFEANGYEVTVAYDGEEGVKKARAILPDLIILDLLMPKLDGYQVCNLLKQDSLTREIPILILTASQERELEKNCLRLGASYVVMKPFETQELLQIVKEVLA